MWSAELNPRTRRLLQKALAMALFLLSVLVVVLTFVPIQYPSWFIEAFQWLWTWQWKDNPLWPRVIGLSPSAHYSARIFLTLAFGLTIFLPQVEVTFVSLLRRRSPIGAPYIDRKKFECPNCRTVNRPHVQFCVRCGTSISGVTQHWGVPIGVGHERLASLARSLLVLGWLLSFFIGLFDLTLYSLLTGLLGLDTVTVFFATIVSALPTLAGYVALKEGVLRRWGSLRRFEKAVFGNLVWVLFGVLFLMLALSALMGPPPQVLGSVLVMWMQLLLGLVFVMHPLLRRRLASTTATVYYP